MKQSQTEKLYQLLSDGKPHATTEICAIVYGGEDLKLARVAARIYDVKQKYGVKIPPAKQDEHNATIHWYHIEEEKQSLFSRTKTYIEAWLQKEPNKVFSRFDLEETAIKHGYEKDEVKNTMQAIENLFSPIIW